MKHAGKGVLLLSHCGYSFMEDLCNVIHKMGLESYVLSSQPLADPTKRTRELEQLVDNLSIVQSHVLQQKDILAFIDKLQLENKQIVACLSVWEGYRELMAQTNSLLNVNDLIETSATLLRDKFLLRTMLNEKLLSKANVSLLTPENMEDYKNINKRKFIKPRFGIASYGAFELKKTHSWQTILDIKSTIQNDKEYQSIFNQEIDFIAEDYIAGTEYSFEIIVLQGIPYIIAIHEKIDLQEQTATVLEAACISPPLNLSHHAIQCANQWIEQVFKTLTLETGCFHVEAKFHQGTWEVIEINPRVGGAFISKSVEVLTNGDDLLTLWLKILTTQGLANVDHLHGYLNAISSRNKNFFTRENHTFFRVYFATELGLIKNIRINETHQKPLQLKIFLQPGTCINTSAREVFIGQALWKLNDQEFRNIHQLIEESTQLLEVIYG